MQSIVNPICSARVAVHMLVLPRRRFR